jgi:hypothetical protein
VVRDSEPLVLEDQGRREQNRLFAEGQKRKKDMAKKKPSRSAGDSRRVASFPWRSRRQSRNQTMMTLGPPLMRWWRREALVARCPRQVLLSGDQGSWEAWRFWRRGREPGEMLVLRGTSSQAPRPVRPEQILTLPVGGGDASTLRTAPSGASAMAPEARVAGGSPSGEVPPPPPRMTEEAALAIEGWPLAPGAPVCPVLGSSAVGASVVLPLLPPPPPQRQEWGEGTATVVVTTKKKRKIIFP